MRAGHDVPNPSPARKAMLDWMVVQALPLWIDAGWDPQTGLFLERLDGSGRPLADVPRRLMVQARQIFSFSVAARRGWCPAALDRLNQAADAMVRLYYRRDGAPGWIFSVDRSGIPVDSRRDFYSLSFVLLALAKLAVARGDGQALALANETLTFMDAYMASPGGGYVDALPQPPHAQLRQNPHMHLLEALLALHEAAPDGDYLERARGVVTLLTSRFLHGQPPVLAEFFDPNWKVLGGPDISFEPGHHFEWAWLLTRHAELSKGALPEVAASLWTTAVTVGLSRDLVIFDEVSPARGVIQRSTRLWPYCEAAKAACFFSASNPTADSFLTSLLERFLKPAYPGSWVDHFRP